LFALEFFPGKPFRAFLVLSPTLLPDEFAVYSDEEGNQTVFVWMVAPTKAEVGFCAANPMEQTRRYFRRARGRSR
jgi:hypothetical protein